MLIMFEHAQPELVSRRAVLEFNLLALECPFEFLLQPIVGGGPCITYGGMMEQYVVGGAVHSIGLQMVVPVPRTVIGLCRTIVPRRIGCRFRLREEVIIAAMTGARRRRQGAMVRQRALIQLMRDATD